MTKKESKTMKDLLEKEKEAPSLPQPGDIVEGRIIKISNNELILELEPFGVGVIYGAELRENRDMVRNLEIGKKISALVLDSENDDNYIELSLKEANIEKGWTDIKKKEEDNETVSVRVIEANKGGLVIRLSGIIGFLPVSQLSSENYPKVEDGDKNRILQERNSAFYRTLYEVIAGTQQSYLPFFVSFLPISIARMAVSPIPIIADMV